jgi:hypothetical protein
MLLVIGPEPTPENERDGMVQRVRAIDERFSGVSRKLISISFRKNLKAKVVRRSATLEVECLNSFVHFLRWMRYAWKADAIYVHSCLMALKVLPLYFVRAKIITDVHGVVPEETEMQGMRLRALVYQWVERIVVARSDALVLVTESMRDYFTNKYGGIRAHLFIIPILSEMSPPSLPIVRDQNLALYSGGLQRWQCIEETLKIARIVGERMRFLFVTGDPEALKRMACECNLQDVEIRSASWHEMPALYAQATYGFVLREDTIVNTVACPTKLVEYLESGVIPVVKEPNIGDFLRNGYRYVKSGDFTSGLLPSSEGLEKMRDLNRRVIDSMKRKADDEFLRLNEDFGLGAA